MALTDEEVQDLLDAYLRDHTDPLADDTSYRRRLDACQRCPSLKFATTCAFCGCLVQVRAKLADQHCPRPQGRLW